MAFTAELFYDSVYMHVNMDKSEINAQKIVNWNIWKNKLHAVCFPSTSQYKHKVSWNKDNSPKKFSLQTNNLSAQMILVFSGCWVWDLSFSNEENKQG